MKKTLRPYQQDLLDEILLKIPITEKLCVQLSTGGGKTVIFTELVSQLNAKTLILVDSIDLVNQTIDTFKKQGADIGSILAGAKYIPDNKILVGMIKSVWNRKNKLPNFDYCIIDECHVWEFNKIFPYLNNCKIIGFTATPARLKRYSIDETISAQETMSDVYDDIVCGKPISWLMENGYLVKEKNEYIEFDSSPLKTDASGEFTAASLKEVFQHPDYKKALRKTYDKLCEGKKTMIFTSATETNAIYAELFKDKNIKTYDSVNNTPNERDDIIEWFRNERDAILINTGCFTKGFDVCDVECIIMARATKSLSLWVQIAGRGARPTKKIEKPFFTLIDGGNNNKEHQVFSFNRDWEKIFYDKKIKDKLLDITECEECGFTYEVKENFCPNCGHVPEVEEIEDDIPKEPKLFEIQGKKNKVTPPSLDLNFFINKGATKYETLKVLREKWITFLLKIDKIEWHLNNPKEYLIQRFRKYIFPIYANVITSILKDGKHVKYDTLTQKIINDTIQQLQNSKGHE
jgi:superfamily II DNA or RNA helicase